MTDDEPCPCPFDHGDDPIADITPAHDPVGLAKEMLRIAQSDRFEAGIYILVHEDGSMVFDCCGRARKDILWGLERMKMRVLEPSDE